MSDKKRGAQRPAATVSRGASKLKTQQQGARRRRAPARSGRTAPPVVPQHSHNSGGALRRTVLLAGFAFLGALLIGRAVHVQLVEADFYLNEGALRQVRNVVIPAHRGNLLDRNGEPLAISTPIKTLWGEPKRLVEQPAAMREVAALLNLDANKLNARIAEYAANDKAFVYVARHIEPAKVESVLALKVDGLQANREFRRYYPSGPAAAHLVGFTDIDDRGREGLELAYNDWLSGESGKRQLLQDRFGREIDEIEVMKPALPGKDLHLSIDRQLQYIANRALSDVIKRHRAESASLVVMKVRTGEVMAMANYPTYNPNDTADRSGGRQRNRAITDVFEPGSTMKPFTVAAALESGRFQPESIVHTSPGYYEIGEYKISDTKDHGWLDLGGIVTKSSNVGISKVARDLDPEQMWQVFDAFGFGRPPGSEFPGEVAGYFNHPTLWHHIEQASVSYGYGIAVSALQLVRAYAAIANDGVMPPVSFVALDDAPEGQRVIDDTVADQTRKMLESVVLNGTGSRAKIPGYRVAGKTGTSHRSQSGSYAEDRYISLFAGFAPATDPEYATVVVVHDPKAGGHFGSQVAAPVFAEVMSHALRIGGIAPDDIDDQRALVLPLAPDREADRS